MYVYIYIQYLTKGFLSICAPCITLRRAPLDSEMGWPWELWLKTNLLNWKKLENDILIIKSAKKKNIQNLRIFEIYFYFLTLFGLLSYSLWIFRYFGIFWLVFGLASFWNCFDFFRLKFFCKVCNCYQNQSGY